MPDSELTPELHAQIQALTEDWERHTVRTGVDMRQAMPQLRRITPSEERRLSETEVEVTHSLDVSGIVETLRQLPDLAGTDAFVAAYNSRLGDGI